MKREIDYKLHYESDRTIEQERRLIEKARSITRRVPRKPLATKLWQQQRNAARRGKR